MTEPGTMFKDRYRFENERSIQEFTCPDCGGRCAVLIRVYTDLQSENAAGRVETSVRTGCHCVEEIDPYRVETGPVHKLAVEGQWRVEKVQRPIYRVRQE